MINKTIKRNKLCGECAVSIKVVIEFLVRITSNRQYSRL